MVNPALVPLYICTDRQKFRPLLGHILPLIRNPQADRRMISLRVLMS